MGLTANAFLFLQAWQRQLSPFDLPLPEVQFKSPYLLALRRVDNAPMCHL